ncbi:MAG: hypothetical protein MH204_04700, partial [Fimbriimonadaceae bacterium]|nr:hypothetical protein [Fimbriimonadaceae bacterium]
LVNGYQGGFRDVELNPRAGSQFSGEVLVLEGRFAGPDVSGYDPTLPNLGFGPLSIRYVLPPINGIGTLVRPTFAERQ